MDAMNNQQVKKTTNISLEGEQQAKII